MLANLKTATDRSEIDANIAKQQVLTALSQRWNIYDAARTNGISRVTLYAWIAQDPVFASQFQEIKDKHLDGMESNLFHQGANNEKSYVPAIFMLKSYRPERYGDRLEVQNNQVISIDYDSRGILEGVREARKALDADYSVVESRDGEKIEAESEAK